MSAEPHSDPHSVKYQVAPLQRSCIVQLYVPLASAALSLEHSARLDRACIEACALLETARDQIAAELYAGGLCPWCNELAHPSSVCAG